MTAMDGGNAKGLSATILAGASPLRWCAPACWSKIPSNPGSTSNQAARSSTSPPTIAITTLLPWVSYALCRQLSVDGFLPRYTLHWFCPEHLLLLAVWRMMQGDQPSEVPAI